MNPLALDTSLRDKYGPAMEITTQEEADSYFEECVDHCLRCDQQEGGVKTRVEAEKLERSNLGYYAGYYSHETVNKWSACFVVGTRSLGLLLRMALRLRSRHLQWGVKLGAAHSGSSEFPPELRKLLRLT